MTSPASLVFKRVLPASPDEVYDAWTQPSLIAKWLAPGANKVIDVRTDVRVGGQFQICSIAPDETLHRIDGTYRELNRGRRIVMTWSYSGPVELLCEMETLIEIDFSPAPNSEALMTVIQTGLVTDKAAQTYGEGWPTCFDKLGRAFETGKRQ
jgi:uncharacterized protein YndB with AHSA1/START domain